MIKKYLKEDKGVTGFDLTVSVIIIVIFSGLIASLMTNLYKISAEIQSSCNAMAYATIISEKIDEKSFEEVIENEDFYTYLKLNGEIEFSDDYSISVTQSKIVGLEADKIRKIEIVVKYKVSNQQKKINLTKLKIKEIEK